MDPHYKFTYAKRKGIKSMDTYKNYEKNKKKRSFHYQFAKINYEKLNILYKRN